MSTEIAVQPEQKPTIVKASTALAQFLGIAPDMMIETIKQQCFRNMKPGDISDAQLATFVSVANGLKLNPLLPGFLYAYPERNGGITPIIGPDGVFKMLGEHPAIESWETSYKPEDENLPPTSATTKIYRKGSDRPISYTALLSEWKVSSNPNWNTRPRHMLGIRSLKQAARQLIHGLPFDEDEKKIAEMVNVTETAEPEKTSGAVARRETPARNPKGAVAITKAADTKAPEANAVIELDPVIPRAETKPEEPPKAAPAPAADDFDASVTPAPKEPIVQLAKDERVKVKCKFTALSSEVKTKGGKPFWCVFAELDGEFRGSATDIAGSHEVAGKVVPKSPLYVVGGSATLTIVGTERANGTIGHIIESVEAA